MMSPESQFCDSLWSSPLYPCFFFFFDSLLTWSSASVVNRLSQMAGISNQTLYKISRFFNISFCRGTNFMSESISNSMALDLTLNWIHLLALHSSTPSFQVGHWSLGSTFTQLTPQILSLPKLHILFSVLILIESSITCLITS
jgi:hypothetical protein